MKIASYRPALGQVAGWTLLAAALLAGCESSNYKKDADDRAYRAIDEKWEPQFGPRTNYRVSDVAPAPDAVQAAKVVPSSGVLTLPQAVALATAHNRTYQTQRELLYQSALDLRLVRHGYETRLFGGGSVTYLKDDDDSALQAEANVGLNRLLATGTQIATRVGVAWVDILSGRGRDGLGAILGGTVVHPLLRGSDRQVVMEDLTQAERNTLYAIRTFNRFRKEFVVAVISQYYRVAELRAVAAHHAEHLASSRQLEQRVEALVHAAVLPVIELDRVRQDRLGSMEAHILAEKAYESALDELKITLALSPAIEITLEPEILDRDRTAGLATPAFALDEVIETALLRRLDLINRADAVLDAQRHVYVAADQLRAELNLVARADLPAWDAADDRVAAGPLIDLPLDRVPEQHAYRLALIALSQRIRDYDLGIDTVTLDVRRAHRTLTEAAQRYRVALEERGLARERVERTSTLMQYGRASSRRVLDAMDAVLEAETLVTQTLADSMVAILEFYRDTGVLQVRPDGMWRTEPLHLAAFGVDDAGPGGGATP
jgi:outer membrane protein TolC